MLWRKIIVFWQAASSNLVQVVRKGFLEEVTLELGANRRASVSQVKRQESRGKSSPCRWGGHFVLLCPDFPGFSTGNPTVREVLQSRETETVGHPRSGELYVQRP